MRNLGEVLWVFFRLGLTSFGGPIAHLGYFHREFVDRRRWIDEQGFTELVALCQFLPGPASSQVGMAIGLRRAGYLGALGAWIGFTLPSAVLLVIFGLGVSRYPLGGGWLHGLKIVAVAVVAQAIWAMAAKLCPDRERITIAILSAGAVSIFTSASGQLAVIVAGALIGVTRLRGEDRESRPALPDRPISRFAGAAFLAIFILILLTLPILAQASGNHAIQIFDRFFRAGSLVFGGGHVVLPLLHAAVVPSGWVSNDLFLAGYGAAQAIPGPLFSFSAYLGAVSALPPSGWAGAAICLLAAFLPSFLLIAGALPFWQDLRRYRRARAAMLGINASVVGLLISAFYHPIWTSAVFDRRDFALAALCVLLLAILKLPAWSVVVFGAAMAAMFG